MTTPLLGTLIGIARAPAPHAPMEDLVQGLITSERGLDGDHKGAKFPNRRVTVLAREAWEAALADLGEPASPASGAELRWTTRRANLLIEGIALPQVRGAFVRIGPVLLEVTGPTHPCQRMEEARPGLLAALRPDWRGGVSCRVLEGGILVLGDVVTALLPPHEAEAGEAASAGG